MAGGPPASAEVCAQALPTLAGPCPGRGGGTGGKAALRDRRAHLGHEAQVEVEVVERGELARERVVDQREMPQGAAAEVRARVAPAALLHRPCVPCVPRVADHELAFPG